MDPDRFDSIARTLTTLASRRGVLAGVALAIALSASAGYAIQEFTLDEAQSRIERLEARVAALEEALELPDEHEVRQTHTVSGTVTLVDRENFTGETIAVPAVGKTCIGSGGYDDIDAGASVRAMNESGDIVGSSRLDSGTVAWLTPDEIGCEFYWTVEVQDAEFYVFEIANRGGPSFSKEELEVADWTVDLSIGP